MKHFILLMSFILLGCFNNSENAVIKKKYLFELQLYHFYYPPITNTEELQDFKEYLRINYSGDQILNGQNYNLNLDNTKNRILIKSKKSKKEIASILISEEIGLPDWCNNDVSIKGFFSKNFEQINWNTKIFNDYLNENFKSYFFSKHLKGNSNDSNLKRVVFKFENGKLSKVCSNLCADCIPLEIEKEIQNYFNQSGDSINYALIPIVLKDTRN